MKKRLIELLQCNICYHHPLQIDHSTKLKDDDREEARLICPNCKTIFPAQDSIFDFLQIASPEIRDEIKASEDVALMWANQESIYNEKYLLSLPWLNDPRASNYQEWRRKAVYFEQILNMIPNGENRVLLELGAGVTWATRYFAKKGYYAIALEIVKGYLRGLATSKFYQEKEEIYYENILAPMEKIPLKNCSVDVIFSISSLHHSYDPLAVFSEIYRLLSQNGQAYIMEDGVGLFWLYPRRKEAKDHREKMHHHDHAYTFRDYRQAIKKAGLTYSLIIPDKFINEIGIFRKLPPSLLTFFYKIVLFLRGCGFILCLKKKEEKTIK